MTATAIPDYVAFRPARRIVGAVFVAPWCGARFLVLGGGRRPIAGLPGFRESFLTVQTLDSGDGADRWPLHPSELRHGRAQRVRAAGAVLRALEDAADADRARWGRCSPYNGNGREYAARLLREARLERRAARRLRRLPYGGRGHWEACDARTSVALAVCARRNVATWPVLP